MRTAEYFLGRLPNAPVRELMGILVRRVPLLDMLKAVPLDFLFTSGRAHRYNLRGVPCIYFAEDEATAAAEYDRHNTWHKQPFSTYFAKVKLRRTLDLCDAGAPSALGLAPRDLQAPWVGARVPTVTQLLGEAVCKNTDISAIRFPSEAAIAKGFAGANVVVFRDRVMAPDVVSIMGPTKKPLQKWP